MAKAVDPAAGSRKKSHQEAKGIRSTAEGKVNEAASAEPGLSPAEKRQGKRKRQAKIAAWALKNADHSSATEQEHIRTFSTPITVSGASLNQQFPVYLPNPVLGDGRRRRRKLVVRLQTACGLAALSAHASLMEQHRGETDRHEQAIRLVQKHANLSQDYLNRLGNKEVAKKSPAVQHFGTLTTLLYVQLQASGMSLPNDQAQTRLDALGLLSTAFSRAQSVIKAVDDAAKLRRETGAWERLEAEFASDARAAAITRLDMVRIAALADVNPVALWPQHAQFMAPVLEIARFGAGLVKGRHGGGQVRLHKSLFAQALKILGTPDEWPDDRDADAAFRVVRYLVGSCCDLDELAGMIELHRNFDLDLVLGEAKR